MNEKIKNWFNNQFSFNPNFKSLDEQNRRMNLNSSKDSAQNRQFHIQELPYQVKTMYDA